MIESTVCGVARTSKRDPPAAHVRVRVVRKARKRTWSPRARRSENVQPIARREDSAGERKERSCNYWAARRVLLVRPLRTCA